MRTIQGYVGQPLVELLRLNDEKMDFNRRYDDSPLIFPDDDTSGEILHFIYSMPDAKIDLPQARLIWISQVAGLVTEITVDTSEQKGTLADLYSQLYALRKGLIEAHWEEIQPIGSYNDLQATISRSEGTTNSFGTGKYKKGNTEALIMLTTPGAVMTPDKVAQASFIAEIWFHDEVLSKRQSDKAYAARKKVNGSDGISLPLSYWIGSDGQGKNPSYTVSELVKLDVELAGSQVIVYIIAANPSTKNALFLERKKIVASPPVRVNLFHILCEGSEIPYTGALAKTEAATQDDFFRLNPASEIRGYANITDLYAFRPGEHTYTISYDSLHGDPNNATKLTEITSPVAQFRLRR